MESRENALPDVTAVRAPALPAQSILWEKGWEGALEAPSDF